MMELLLSLCVARLFAYLAAMNKDGIFRIEVPWWKFEMRLKRRNFLISQPRNLELLLVVLYILVIISHCRFFASHPLIACSVSDLPVQSDPSEWCECALSAVTRPSGSSMRISCWWWKRLSLHTTTHGGKYLTVSRAAILIADYREIRCDIHVSATETKRFPLWTCNGAGSIDVVSHLLHILYPLNTPGSIHRSTAILDK